MNARIEYAVCHHDVANNWQFIHMPLAWQQFISKLLKLFLKIYYNNIKNATSPQKIASSCLTKHLNFRRFAICKNTFAFTTNTSFTLRFTHSLYSCVFRSRNFRRFLSVALCHPHFRFLLQATCKLRRYLLKIVGLFYLH